MCPKHDHHIKGRVVTSHTKHDQDNQSQDRQSLCGLSMRINEKGWDIRPGIKSNPLVKSHIQRQNLGKCITWKAKRQVYIKKQSDIVVEYKTNKVIRRKHTSLHSRFGAYSSTRINSTENSMPAPWKQYDFHPPDYTIPQYQIHHVLL